MLYVKLHLGVRVLLGIECWVINISRTETTCV